MISILGEERVSTGSPGSGNGWLSVGDGRRELGLDSGDLGARPGSA